MTIQQIIEKLKSGVQFYCPYNMSNIHFKVLEWNGDENEEARIACISDASTWEEQWNDMEFTIKAFLIGEYKFI